MSSTLTKSLSISGEVATLTITADCLSAVYVQDQWNGQGPDRLWLQPGYRAPSNQCLKRSICVWMPFVYYCSGDGFAEDSGSFEASQDYLEYLKDSSHTYFFALPFDLSDRPLPGQVPILDAFVLLSDVSEIGSIDATADIVDSIPGTAPIHDTSPHGISVIPRDGQIRLDLTDLLNTKISAAGEGETIDAINVLAKFRPTGSSGDPVQFGSSRGAAGAVPRLYIRRN